MQGVRPGSRSSTRATSRALWRSVRDVKPFAAQAARQRPLWRISTPPARGHEIAAAITPAAQMFYDWAGGLIWVAMPFADEPDAAAVRGAVAAMRRPRHARSARRPRCAARSMCSSRRTPALAALTKRVKESFDPEGRAQSRPHVGGG